MVTIGRTALDAVALALLVGLMLGATALGDHATYIVASDGSGDHDSIAGAVRQASDGDTIVVLPGRYRGALTIDRDIELRGDGPVESVVLALDADRSLRIVSSDAIISGLTLTGPSSNGIEISGGAPTLSGLMLQDLGVSDTSASACEGVCRSVTITDGSLAIVEGSTITGSGPIRVENGASPRIVANELSGGPYISLFDVGDGTIVRGNRIEGTAETAIGVFRPTRATIEGNSIVGFDGVGIEVWLLAGTDPLIRGNTIEGGSTGIHVLNDARPTIVGNDLFANGTGIGSTNSSPLIEANRIHANDRGIGMSRGSPMLKDNVISENATGIDIAQGATPTLDGNTFCENGYDINLRRGAEPPATEGNYGCSQPAEG